MVVDTSVILSIFFKEKYCDWATDQMNNHMKELRMSTVNLTEVLNIKSLLTDVNLIAHTDNKED